MSSSLALPDTAQVTLPAMVSRILYPQQLLARRVQELGRQITADYHLAGANLITFGILKGVLPFLADLLREIDLPLQTDVMTIAGYRPNQFHPQEAQPPGAARITKDLEISVTGKHVLVIEDMVDTGLTLNFILKMIKQRQPASLAIATLFNREANRLVTNLPVNYIGFEAPDEFLVGYGLDYHEQFRNLPYVGVLKSEVYSR